MRHFIVSRSITTGALRMGKTPAARTLVTLSRFAQARAPGRLRTAAGAIDLASIAAAANEHLRPAAGAQEEAARGQHRRSPWNADGRSISTGSAQPWNTAAARVPVLGPVAPHLCPVWRDPGVNLAV